MKLQHQLLQYSLLIFLFFLNANIAISKNIDSPNKIAKSSIIQKKPYRFPFENYEAFIEFMKGSKFAKPPWSNSELRASFPETVYEKCLNPKQMQFWEILYQSPNGITRGWTVRPKTSEKALPIVVFNRGGFAKWGRIVPFELASLCRIAAQGYMVIASDFRGLKEGTGKQDKTDLGYGDVQDSFYLIDAISQEHADLDTDNLAVWGFSRGTTLSAMMATQSDKIRLVILHGMVTDLINDSRRAEFDEHVYPLLVNNYAKLAKSKQNKLLAGITPALLINQIKGNPGFLILHGGKDTRTSAYDALIYASKLLERKHSVEFHLYSQSGHTLSGNYNEYINKVIDALNQYLPTD
ncbi:alpha/beta hydrolase family protein [Aliikangiella sp. IMCC44359]|uniref:alpha/beta hydrolase family protein n=1 Tax=Aliikangiella sp. IMCC44359 TaxID=3459125 RepID=UPI00403B2387